MTFVRPSSTRGTTRESWLDSRHGFSFGAYLDADAMRFGPLSTLNEDRIAGAQQGQHGI